MKFLFSFLAFILLGGTLAFGQYSKGDKEYVAKFGVAIDKNQNSYYSDEMDLDFETRFGWFVKDNVSVGIEASISHDDQHRPLADSFERNDQTLHWSTGVYVRRYFHLKRFKPFLNPSLKFYRRSNNAQVKYDDGSRWDSGSFTHGVGMSLMTGLQFELNNWLSLEASLNSLFYSTLYSSTQSGTDSSSRGVRLKSTLTLDRSALRWGVRFKI